MDTVVEFGPIVRIKNDRARAEHDVVIDERPMTIVVNGWKAQTLMSSPGLERELAAGFCLTQGLVPAAADLTVGPFDGQSVEVASDPAPPVKDPDSPGFKSASGGGYPDLDQEWMARQAELMARSPLTVDASALSDMTAGMTARQEIYAATGGAHAAAVAETGGRLVVMAEDVGRHNALDKAVGAAVMKNVDLTRQALVLSGRTSVEMMLKAARAQMVCVVSVSAPTRLALDAALKMNMTYAGFSRPGRLNVYTGLERVIFQGRPLSEML